MSMNRTIHPTINPLLGRKSRRKERAGQTNVIEAKWSKSNRFLLVAAGVFQRTRGLVLWREEAERLKRGEGG